MSIYMYTDRTLHYVTTLLYSIHVFPSLSLWSPDPMDIFDPPDRETMRLQKFGKLLAGPNTDLGQTIFHNSFANLVHVLH